MRLPPLLQPWSAWLTLLPADLAAALGDLLLRLDPVLGPLRRHAASRQADPAGIGDIVRRGNYDRLLISQWAYADSAPDEFLRRAANGELLFTGPEPAHSEESLRSIVLFDAGPAQLGEPRLAHLALLILLARRAGLARAEFCWGTLQEPGTLHRNAGKESIVHLLKARSYAVANDAALEEWQAVLGDSATDCWLVGEPGSPCPPQVRARVLVRRSLLDDQLDVVVRERRRERAVTLPLPAPDAAVRLLRRPFEAIGKASVQQSAAGAHSLKRPPRFGNLRAWVAVDMADNGATVYHVPDSPIARPGRPRQGGSRHHSNSVIAAGLCQKFHATVALMNNALHFSGFPGPLFNDAPNLPVPEQEAYHFVPGKRYHDPAFHLLHRRMKSVSERVLVLDQKGQLACWSRHGDMGGNVARTEFSVIARHVIGAVQIGSDLLFAVCVEDRIDTYLLRAKADATAALDPPIHARGDRLLFGDPNAWRSGGRRPYALRLPNRNWIVGDGRGYEYIAVHEDAVVLGCSRLSDKAPDGLVVLAAGRLTIDFLAGDQRMPLVAATEPIAQASFDAAHGRLAWLGSKSGALTVRDIRTGQTLLQTIPHEGPDAD